MCIYTLKNKCNFLYVFKIFKKIIFTWLQESYQWKNTLYSTCMQHEMPQSLLVFKARCTPEKLTILAKHCKTFFFNHVVKNIVNYQLQKLYIKRTSIKGSNHAFATWCHSALKYL